MWNDLGFPLVIRIKQIVFIVFFLCFSSLFSIYSQAQLTNVEKGTYDIYFMDEKVGYEEYVWQADETGYTLKVRGRMTKPVPLDLDELTIRINRSFIPESFYFKGSVSGMDQEISSKIQEGMVENKVQVAGQESAIVEKVRRDAFLLPNPIFSPYMILTRKFRCGAGEETELSAYIIPQMETLFTLQNDEENPCLLVMEISGTKIELFTDEAGNLNSLSIPSQRLRVVLNK